jgi:hypothetical protein
MAIIHLSLYLDKTILCWNSQVAASSKGPEFVFKRAFYRLLCVSSENVRPNSIIPIYLRKDRHTKCTKFYSTYNFSLNNSVVIEYNMLQ